MYCSPGWWSGRALSVRTEAAWMLRPPGPTAPVPQAVELVGSLVGAGCLATHGQHGVLFGAALLSPQPSNATCQDAPTKIGVHSACSVPSMPAHHAPQLPLSGVPAESAGWPVDRLQGRGPQVTCRAIRRGMGGEEACHPVSPGPHSREYTRCMHECMHLCQQAHDHPPAQAAPRP